MRSSRTTREGWFFPGFAILPPSFNPIETAYLCKQASSNPKKDTLLQTESCSQWNHDQSFSPRFFFPPSSSNGSSPSEEDLSGTREVHPFSMTGVKRKYKRKKSWERRGIRQGYVAADEKAAHVITFPVTTRCREQFILFSIPFLSALLSPTSFVFLSHSCLRLPSFFLSLF